MNGCLHECPACKGLFEHARYCGESFNDALCMTCDKAGYVMRECGVCHDLKPILRGWACEGCIREKRVVA